MHALRPDLIVTHLRDEGSFRQEIERDSATAGVPVISLTAATEAPAALVEEIRRVLRARAVDGH
jgi:hypothetical protein